MTLVRLGVETAGSIAPKQVIRIWSREADRVQHGFEVMSCPFPESTSLSFHAALPRLPNDGWAMVLARAAPELVGIAHR